MDMKAIKDGRMSSSHHLTPLVGIQKKKNLIMITQLLKKKVHYHSHWKRNQDAVYWVKLSRAQEQGLQFWQTKSHAIVVHSPVPADCIYKVMSQNGDRILFERLSTPRPAPKVTLKSTWQSQQQQQQQSICDGLTGATKVVARESQSGTKDVKGSTNDQTCIRRLVRGFEPAVEKKPQFEIDLQVEGVSKEVILKDEEKMKKRWMTSTKS